MTTTIVHSERVIRRDGATYSIGPAAIAVSGHTIASVIPGPAPIGALQLGDRIVAPAFVNSHTHLALSALRGAGLDALQTNVVEDFYYRIETGYAPGDIGVFARLGAAECLLTGTATVWEHYYAARDMADALVGSGLCAVLAPTLQDLDGPGVPDLETQLAQTAAIDDDPALADAGVVAALGPHATDTVSPALWDRIARLASDRALPLHFHAAQSREEYRRTRAREGLGPLAYLARGGWLDAAPAAMLVHGQYVHRAELDALDPTRVVLGFCPGSQMNYCFPAPVRRWRSLGFEVAVGTDCGASNDSMNVQQELRLIAGGPQFGVPSGPEFTGFFEGEHTDANRVARVRWARMADGELDPAALLAMVWDIPGRMHPKLKVGAIEPGFRAHLVVYDPDHPSFWPGDNALRALAYQDVAPAIERMMVNGRWLSEPGAHQRTIVDDALRGLARDGRERVRRLLGSA